MEPSLSEAKTPVSRLCLCSAPLARKRETQKFCLTPRLSLQLYYIPVLAPEVAGRRDRSGTGAGGRGGGARGGASGAAVWVPGWAGAQRPLASPAPVLGPPSLGGELGETWRAAVLEATEGGPAGRL